MNLVSDLLNVTSSPHVRDKMDTQKIMALVVISLLPASIFGICNFGLHALVLILVTIASCVASEWIYEKIVHKKSTINDLSAVVTGLHEPGTGSKMFPFDLLYRIYDKFYL